MGFAERRTRRIERRCDVIDRKDFEEESVKRGKWVMEERRLRGTIEKWKRRRREGESQIKSE